MHLHGETNSMNQKLRLASLLLMLPLFTVALTTHAYQEADAEKAQGSVGYVGPKSFGSKNAAKICGDELCSAKAKSSIMSDKMISDKKMSDKMISDKKMSDKMISDKKMSDKMISDKKMSDKMMPDEMVKSSEYALKLSRTNVPATIPLHKGWYNGQSVYYIITDSSEQKHADIITEKQGWKVELAPLLATTPTDALSKTYIFTNGVKGDGIHGFQGEIFTSTPAQPETYSALTSHTHVTWNDGVKAEILDSEKKIMAAEKAGKITLTDLPVVINMPQIMWPEGQLQVREDKNISDETTYTGGQITDINTEKMTVTFVAHRGWGPDGRTIYYIVTDATPEMPAEMMGVVNSPTSARLIANSAAVDLYQFMNGVKGSGPMGFQAGIAAAAPGDANYSPMWRIFMIGWKDQPSAMILENLDDINALRSEGKIDVNLARPMDKDHIVNCPFIDPFQ